MMKISGKHYYMPQIVSRKIKVSPPKQHQIAVTITNPSVKKSPQVTITTDATNSTSFDFKKFVESVASVFGKLFGRK